MARKRNSDNDMILSGGAAPSRRKAGGPARARVAKPVEAGASIARDAVTIPAAAETVPSAEPTPLAASPAPAPEPTREEIAALAYSYWEARGCQGGSPDQDWIRAEEELRAHYNGASAAHA